MVVDEEGVRSRSVQRMGRSRCCSTSSCTPLGRLPRLTFIFDSNAARSRGKESETSGTGEGRWVDARAHRVAKLLLITIPTAYKQPRWTDFLALMR